MHLHNINFHRSSTMRLFQMCNAARHIFSFGLFHLPMHDRQSSVKLTHAPYRTRVHCTYRLRLHERRRRRRRAQQSKYSAQKCVTRKLILIPMKKKKKKKWKGKCRNRIDFEDEDEESFRFDCIHELNFSDALHSVVMELFRHFLFFCSFVVVIVASGMRTYQRDMKCSAERVKNNDDLSNGNSQLDRKLRFGN